MRCWQEQLETWKEAGELTTACLAFADLMWRLNGGEENSPLPVVAALAYQMPQRGHSCLEWDRLPELAPFLRGSEMMAMLESLTEEWWSEQRVVGSPSDKTPLVWIDGERRLYLYRFWQAEQQVALAMAGRDKTAPFPSNHRNTVESWFDLNHPGERGQCEAVLAAMEHGFFLLTGGPGTGKTTTVARYIEALRLVQSDARVVLAAPTGKAAARLAEAVNAHLGGPAGSGKTTPLEGATLHRLLGYMPLTKEFRYHPNRPVPCDAVVVDEASMMDLPLAAALCEAVAPSTRLLLVGDGDQLPSVRLGQVLSDACRVYADRSSCRFDLKHNFRFRECGGIAKLADAVRKTDKNAVRFVLSGEAEGIPARLGTLPSRSELLSSLDGMVSRYYDEVLNNRGYEEAFDCLNRFRLLCVHRRGPYGVEEINTLVERLLWRRQSIPAGTGLYQGKPIIVRENDHTLDLFNGDTGILWAENGELKAWFQGDKNGWRSFQPGRLPRWESAYALTVHQTQGSEFDKVLLILPPKSSPLLSRELLYTGITRAREAVEIWGSMDLVDEALDRPFLRASGLHERIGGGKE